MGSYQKGIETKNSIVEASRELFYNNGYRNTTMRQIAKGAECGLGLMTYYFKSKADIAAIIYTAIRTELHEKLKPIYSYDENPKLHIIINAMIDLFLILTNKQYGTFYNEICYEESVIRRQKGSIMQLMNRYASMSHSTDAKLHNYKYDLDLHILLAIKPQIVFAFHNSHTDIPVKFAIEYFINKYLYILGEDVNKIKELSETGISELDSLNIGMHKNYNINIGKK